MKRFALFLGGLLVLPAFGEVAPVYYDDISEYADIADNDAEYEFYDEEMLEESDDSVAPAAKQPAVKISRQQNASRNIANRTTASRGTPSGASSANVTGRGNTTGNSSRAVAARTTTNASRAVAARGTNGRGVTSRTTSVPAAGATHLATDAVDASRAAATRATGGASRGTATRTGTAAAKSTTARTATAGATVTAANRASTSRAARTTPVTKLLKTDDILTDDTVEKTLYNPNETLYNPNRVSIRSSTTMNNRVPTIRMASSGSISTTETSITATDTSQMDELAELTDYCKAQYMACMDTYCNVLDDNQGRCSCSANLKNYAKTEEALKKATEELQEVAQKIQYIGLTAREVESLFTQTEAELQMEKKTDNSQLKTSLDKVKDMIIDAKSNTSSYSSSSSGLSFDLSGLLDFTIDSTGFDINSFLGGFLSNGSDVKNQRGADLYRTATARCKSNVLKSCTAQGVDASLITNAYDLEIDRECLAYERDLNDSNDQMSATVRNAKSVLQKARLLVAQSKNEYDMLGCVNALDACMQDEFVCGSDYENCLDPSGRYIVNGELIIGTDPGRAVNGAPNNPTDVGVLNGNICSMNLYNVWNYGDSTPGQTGGSQANCKNAWNSNSLDSGNGNLKDYIDKTIFGDESGADNGTKSIGMSQFLQNKIGWVTKDTQNGTRNYGMCVSILNKCQDYTYERKGTGTEYKFDNEVIKQYLYRVMVQIKAKQDEILSDYAESCISDVNTCLSQNNYPASLEDGDWDATQANIAVNACRSTIVTCMSVNGYSVESPTPSQLSNWVCGLKFNDPTCTPDDGDTPTPSTPNWLTVTLNDAGADTASNPTKLYYDQNGVCSGWHSSKNNACTGVISAITTKPTKNGCTYAGHYTGQNGQGRAFIDSNKNIVADYTPLEDFTIYAKWENCTGPSQTYSVTWNNNGGTATDAENNCVGSYEYSNQGQSLTCSVQKNGYTFDGWYKDANFTQRWSSTATIALPSQYTGNIVAYARWQEESPTTPSWLTVTLDDAGADTASNPTKLYYDQNGVCSGWHSSKNNACTGVISAITTKPTKNGCTYAGHYTGQNGQGRAFIDSNKNIVADYGVGEDSTIYAHWTGCVSSPTTYSLVFTCGTGCNGPEPDTESLSAGAVSLANYGSCADAGQSISGWSCVKTGTSTSVSVMGSQTGGFSINLADNTTCTATCGGGGGNNSNYNKPIVIESIESIE